MRKFSIRVQSDEDYEQVYRTAARRKIHTVLAEDLYSRILTRRDADFSDIVLYYYGREPGDMGLYGWDRFEHCHVKTVIPAKAFAQDKLFRLLYI